MGQYFGFFEGLMIRIAGPMSFRLFLQPCMALFFSIRDGIKDAKENKPPFFWALFTSSEHRSEMIKTGWKSISKVFILTVILDLVFQYVQFGNVSRWLGAIVAGFVLAIIPYIILRGPVNRIARFFMKGDKQ